MLDLHLNYFVKLLIHNFSFVQPVFVFSVDFPIPIYLGRGYDVSMNVGEAVIVIQNYQRKVSTGLFCGGNVQYMNGRNPIGPMLFNIASRILGMSHSHIDGSYTTPTSTHYCGDSPVFLNVDKVPVFSIVDIVSDRIVYMISIAYDVI